MHERGGAELGGVKTGLEACAQPEVVRVAGLLAGMAAPELAQRRRHRIEAGHDDGRGRRRLGDEVRVTIGERGLARARDEDSLRLADRDLRQPERAQHLHAELHRRDPSAFLGNRGGKRLDRRRKELAVTQRVVRLSGGSGSGDGW